MTQVNQFNVDEIKKLFQRKGYVWYDDGKLNIIGVRNSVVENAVTDRFDDWILVIFKKKPSDAGYNYFQYPLTTDPGARFVRNFENPQGVARLKPGQYKDTYTIDIHRQGDTIGGNYYALCQRTGPVTVYRDNNRDNRYNEGVEDSGYFGINIHRSTVSGTRLTIGYASAGCQVFANGGDFNQFMSIAYERRNSGIQNKFTYTLIKSEELSVVPATQNAVIPPYTVYARTETTSTRVGARRSRETTATTITPYIASLESFHPNIQYELTRRRLAKNTAQTHAPFVKLTSLMYINKDNLTGGADKSAWCPTLGVHEKQDLKFEEIYNPSANGRSTIGYATSAAGRVPVVISEEDSQFDQPNIPPPGITSMTTERSTVGPMGVRGGLFKANVKIMAYSVGQLNALMKYFMRPATRVVLEYGRLSSEQNPEDITPYNWVVDNNGQPRTVSSVTNDPEDGFKKLITLQASQQQFIQKYVYNNYGNYEIFIGYVVKFALKYGKNNTYEIDLTIHSVQQFEIPAKYSGAKPLCRGGSSINDPCKVLDVHEYFDDASSWKQNSFNKLLTKVFFEVDSELSKEWISHVIPIRSTDASVGGAQLNGANNPSTGTGIGGYYVSWKFFVNVILNDRENGLMSLFNTTGESANYIQSNFIKPLGGRGATPTADNNSLLADEVGYHPVLRSTNAGVMLVYNSGQTSTSEAAINRIRAINSALVLAESGSYSPPNLEDTSIYNNIVNNPDVGDFKSAGDTSFLTNGVWINTNAIKQAFTGADTVSAGINALLGYMNASVGGYWNLQLISNDTERPGLHVIDALPKFSENSTQSSDVLKEMDETSITDSSTFDNVETFKNGVRTVQINNTEAINIDRPKYLYMFNRKTKQLTDDDLGSELLDINISFDLPQVIAVQAIANIGGVAQRGTLNAIDINELKGLSLIPEVYAECTAPSDSAVCPDDTAEPPSEWYKDHMGILRYGPRAREYREYNMTPETAQKEIDQNPNLVAALREYGNLGQALRLIEFNPPKMVQEMDKTSSGTNTKSKVHPFNSSNLTKSIVDLTLPGIGGIQIFQTFAVDRIPQLLKRGVYTVTKVAHEFSVQNGWVTKIQGRFRYRPRDDEQ